MRSFLTIVVGLLIAPLAWAGEGASTITLRSTVFVGVGEALTLSSVAQLSGPEADRLAGTTIDLGSIRADAGGWRTIDAQGVREALESADPLWGSLQLRGGPCHVRVVSIEPLAPHIATQPVLPDAPAMPGTVRELAERWIASRFKAAPRDVEIRWVSASEGLLDHATADLLPHIDDAGRSDRMSLRITMYDARANVVVEGEARAEVRIRREVAVLTRDVNKRRVLTADDLRIERQWTDATASPADTASLIGREAATNLNAGAVVGTSDVHSGVAIKRGDRVQVLVISRTVTATLLARALADGRPGEVIQFESIAPSRSDRLRFSAKVEKAGSAVAVTETLGP